MRAPYLTLLSLMLTLPAAHAMDLAGAWQAALDSDPAWLAARQTLDASLENKALSRAYLLPRIDVTGSTTQNDRLVVGVGQSISFHQRQLGVTAVQPLFHADAWHGYKEARASTSAAEANFVSEQQNELLKVATAYFKVLSAQENLAYNKAEEAALSRQMDQSQQRFDVGLIAITDVLEARAQFDAASAARIAAEAELSTARENLAAIVGTDPGTLAPLKVDVPMNKPVPESVDDWTRTAEDVNPALNVARYNLQGAREATNVQRAGYLPSVDLVGQYNNTNIPNAGNSNNPILVFSAGRSTSIGLQANWNVFGGGRTAASVRQAGYQEAAARDNVEAVRRRVVSNTRNAFLNVAANAYQVNAARQAVKSTEAALAADQAGYEVGTRNVVDVLLTQSHLYAAKRDYANARYNYVINTLQLKAASGELGEADITTLNGWLDPNADIVASPEAPAPASAAPGKPAATRHK